MSETEKSLFDRIGGAKTLAAIVEEMYSRVFADTELAPFFAKVSPERLRRMQFEFLSSAFDGPVNYSGAELTAIHAGRGIRAKHFARFCDHFATAAEDHGVGKRDLDDALGRLAIYKDKITGETSLDG